MIVRLLPQIAVHTQMKVHQRTYKRTEVFDSRLFPARSLAWVWPQLHELGRRSRLSPEQDQEMRYLQRGLGIASKLKTWMDIATTRPEDVVLEQVLALFNEYEDNLVTTVGDNNSSARLSGSIRNLVERVVKKHSKDARTSNIRQHYRVRCVIRSRGRALLSDVPHPARPLIKALPHESLSQLTKETTAVLSWDLEQFNKAAVAVLRRYELALENVQLLRNLRIAPADGESIRNKVLRLAYVGDEQNWSAEELQTYVALELEIREGKAQEFGRPEYPKQRYPHNLNNYMKGLLCGLSNGTTLPFWLDIEIAPPVEVLLSCALIIQMKTAWNFISVLELEPHMLVADKFPLQLQSTKPKTKDKTPIVLIERSDEEVLLALKVLRERYQRLILSGIQGPSVFASSRSARSGKGDAVSGWDSSLKKFCRTYSLPTCSAEMVRNQVLAYRATTRSILSARSTAGHLSENTTLGYINKILVQRLNSANSFEFDKRFDATVHYMIDPKRVAKDQKILAYPIGDGASCKSPSQPPKQEWLVDGACSGRECHKNGGCPNRKIVIDLARIEEVVRTKRYYDANAIRLLNENEAAFAADHLPNLEFNYALFGLLKRGPYRHLVKRFDNE